MGDMADWNIEQGMDALSMHHAGMCEGRCPYCDDEVADEERKAKLSRPRRPSGE